MGSKSATYSRPQFIHNPSFGPADQRLKTRKFPQKYYSACFSTDSSPESRLLGSLWGPCRTRPEVTGL